jgi:prepilin-type N-terminal cleavage/methylation domain-containing protein
MMTRHRRNGVSGANGRSRDGFTLIEVLLALVIGGMAISGAALLLMSLSDRGRAIDAVAWRVDREANAERLLRTTVRNLKLSSDMTPSLEGSATSTRFRSWCDSPTGWPVPCSVHLSIRETAHGQTLSLELRQSHPGTRPGIDPDSPTVIDLWNRLQSARILYLIDTGQGGRWTDQWSGLVPPPAVGVVVNSDTLILPVRANG